MRALLALFGALSLFAADPLRIVAVEREGLPPYEDDQRLYRLQGQARVSPGALLELARPGGRAIPGRLRVVRTTNGGVLARLDRRGDTFPMKGDVALFFEQAHLPGMPATGEVAAAPTLMETSLTVPREPRRLFEALYFLPGDATLSPMGRAKLETWARDCGQGHWVLELPVRKGAAVRLDLARAKVLKAALETLGLKAVQIRTVPLVPGQRPEAVYVHYQEGAPAKVPPTRKA